MSDRKAFTLIELLVVIAIIGVLMGILMPALNRVKKSARTTACLMNLHQWAYIWTMYCDDNNGYFPEATDLNWKRGTWITALRSQWRTQTDILRCPEAMKRRPETQNAAVGGPHTSYVMGGGGIGDLQEECSYGMNNWLIKARPGETAIQGRPTEYNYQSKDAKNVARVPVFADTMWRGGGPFYQNGNHTSPRIAPPEYDGQWASYNHEMKHFAINRHHGFVNHLFLDWSARKVGLKELWTLKWHRQFNTAGAWTRVGGVTSTDWPQWLRPFKDY